MRITSRGRALRVTAAGLAVFLAGGCAQQFKRQEKAIEEQPINCATAEGDIRVLRSEKANLAQEIALGVTAIYPAGLVVGLLTGTEGTKLKVATGDYDRMIDEKIAKIRSTCGVQ
jgi:hypothetical protein